MGPQSAAISREEKRVENKDVRILVVDDEPTMADSLRQNFIEEGYSVDTAAQALRRSNYSIRADIIWPSAICSCRTWMDSRSCVT